MTPSDKFEVGYEVRVIFDSGRVQVLSCFSKTEVSVRVKTYRLDRRTKEILVFRHEKFLNDRYLPIEREL